MGNSPEGKYRAPESPHAAAQAVQEALTFVLGRWKLEILFQLFGGKVKRFSELERSIPEVSQKMLTQQLRQLEQDGLVERAAYAEVPPRVEYSLSAWGQELCPSLDSLLRWAAARPAPVARAE